MTLVAAIRPGDVELPLFLHVLGAMLLVGTLLVSATVLLVAWRRTDVGAVAALTRLGLRTILVGVLPSYVLMRVGAQWTEAAWDYPEGYDPGWLGMGYVIADLGALLLLVAIVLAIIGLRRLRHTTAARSVLGRVVGSISVVLLAAYLVAVWGMTAKPG